LTLPRPGLTIHADLHMTTGKTMLWEAPTFPFTRYLESHYQEILADASKLTVADYDEWPQKDGYTGEWKIFCFYSRSQDWHLAKTCPDRARVVPNTARIVGKIRGVERAVFSMLLPGAHITPHTDGVNGTLDVLRCHLGLMCNEQSGMRVAGTTIYWGPGKCMVFDGQAEHEAANFGKTPRVVCILDVDRDAVDLPVSQ
jgi:Aspartyl/Asparaginyl beta-hydroxylase